MSDNNVAAAILVQTLFQSLEGLQGIMKADVLKNGKVSEQAAANFLKPYFESMLKMLNSGQAFGATRPPT